MTLFLMDSLKKDEEKSYSHRIIKLMFHRAQKQKSSLNIMPFVILSFSGIFKPKTLTLSISGAKITSDCELFYIRH